MGNDVFIVGAGPAGLAAAIALRRKGRHVTVADGAKYPIDKPCGEGLMPGAVQALSALGIRFAASDGFRFRGIRFVDGTRSAQAKFSNGAGVGIRRVELHRKLVEAAQEAGVQFLWNCTVTGIEKSGVIAGRKFYPSQWIVGADGVYSRVAKWSGLRLGASGSWNKGPQRAELRSRAPRYARQQHFRAAPWTDYVEIYWGKTSQAYVTPVARDEVSVVVTSEDPHVKMEQLLKEHGKLRNQLGSNLATGPERGALTGTQRLRRVTRGNVLLLGDASGSVDAITGEGLRLGFEQAFAVKEAVCSGNLDDYEKAHGALFRRPVAMARLMLVLRDYPRLRRRVFAVFSSEPGVFANLLRLHGGQATLGQTAAAGAALGWRLLFAA
jgi:flavin-dependent dehydrogenase